MLIVPCDPLAPRRADDHFTPEAAARAAGVGVALVDHDALAAGNAADGPDAVPPATVGAVGDAVATLGLPFVTVDLVRRDDGAWRVVELGDERVTVRRPTTPLR